MKHIINVIVFSFSMLFSCNSEEATPDNNSGNYIVFGHFYGFCIGEECVEIFKLTNNDLFEDTSDTYPRWDRYHEGQYVRLDQSKFESVKSLLADIPEQLLTEQNTVFGSPDAADGGGVYFAISEQGERRFWVIDQVDSNIPDYLIPFKNKINQSIALINQ